MGTFQQIGSKYGYTGLVEEIKRLLTVDETIAESMFNTTRDQEVLLTRRKAIAEKIEETDKIMMNR